MGVYTYNGRGPSAEKEYKQTKERNQTSDSRGLLLFGERENSSSNDDNDNDSIADCSDLCWNSATNKIRNVVDNVVPRLNNNSGRNITEKQVKGKVSITKTNN